MLKTLFGNKTAMLVLLFLDRNGEAYPSQIARGFGLPVNMIQKQLEKLEVTGILTSLLQGHRRTYRWNTDSPVIILLRHFLSRANVSEAWEPYDGTYLSFEERLALGEDLSREAEYLNKRHRYKPFTITFADFHAYESWRKKQTNPWLA